MTPLVFECPRTRRAIDAGLQTNEHTIAAAGPVNLKLYCPDCCSNHEFPIKSGRLSMSWVPQVLEVPEPPKATALAMAINAVRIFWLRQGLTARQV